MLVVMFFALCQFCKMQISEWAELWKSSCQNTACGTLEKILALRNAFVVGFPPQL